MKLLICTQTVDSNDPNLGFFHRWLEEFSKHAQSITVICLREGDHALPAHVQVKVLSAGRILRSLQLLTLSFRLRKEYDAVFVHMNPEYLLVAGMLWRVLRKKTALWYTHKSVNLKLRFAVLLASVVMTASKESFRLSTHKLQVMGHGIDIERFVCPTRTLGSEIRICTAGRISKTKNIDRMLDAADILQVRGIPFSLTIAGSPGTNKDMEYAEALYGRASTAVVFVGPKTQAEVAMLLCSTDVFLNLSETGSMDKAVLEALATGIPVVSSNEAFKSLLLPYGLFVVCERQQIAEALLRAVHTDVTVLSAQVRTQHSLQNLIPRILSYVS